MSSNRSLMNLFLYFFLVDLTIESVVNEGIINNCKKFIDLFKFICKRLHVDITGSSVVITETTLDQSKIKEDIVVILFDDKTTFLFRLMFGEPISTCC